MPPPGIMCAALFDEESTGKDAAPSPAGGGGEVSTPVDDGRARHMKPLAGIGLGGLIDAHSHWFPENVERKIWAYFDRHYWPITYRYPVPERLDWMELNGVERFTVLNYAHRPCMAAWLNDWTAAFAAGTPRAIPCGTFYPEPEAGAYVRRAIEEYGFRGFKLHLRVGDMDPNDRLLAPAFEQVQQAGLPVIIHAGSAPGRGRYTSPSYIRALVERFPRLKVVVAHMGAWEFEDYLLLAESHDPFYLDTTMIFAGARSLSPFPAGLLKRLEAISDKILFGSDFPNIPYPLTTAVEGVLGLPLSRQARKRMLLDNARVLFPVG